ncbi:putative cytidine deaminase [Erwinia phage vB_EamM_Yoloswag]|uniref:Putative cytidine deaminase n=1 Tax=Erwinia phage vB_EamM_Yoloswag TaxID=1958956 RepID=A0A1S6L2V2_9CAUD|nr:dCMP deaminase [Erwinia phage vB_EamM_Yoloswag]AQT28517.1 putative cytidine deaminase [Erwinia phage vB_EamM_Yoloswag]
MTETKAIAIMASLFGLATISHSRRRSCAAAVVRLVEGVPVMIATGVNGTAPGTENACEPEDLSSTFSHVIHAEDNCLRRYASTCTSQDGDMLFVTDSPCPACFQLVLNTGIRRVYYARGYRIQDHLPLADEHGLEFVQVDLQQVRMALVEAHQRIDRVIC